MSKNRRENRSQTAVNNRLKLQSESYTIVQSAENRSSENESGGKLNLFSRIKTNWLVVLLIGILSLGAFGAGLKYLEDDAKREMAKRESNKGNYLLDKEKSKEPLLNNINPFLPAPLPDPTPQLAKEYIYAGSKLLSVEDAGATAAAPADLAVWRPSSGVWYVLGGQGSAQTIQGWGTNGDDPRPGDYDGDGKTDFCVYRKILNQTSQWWILKSSDGGYYQVTFGTYDDKPAQADFDGDGKTDLALFRPSNGTWYINQSSNSQTITPQFGSNGDEPAPADFDGDGRADIAVWRDLETKFYSVGSSSGQLDINLIGSSGDQPVSSDYD
ncbi:MAG TPA: VCBS repeat-containing protein, partial [Pyrinomonadaceae bacterium]|nr:VCBS repeat-containing protein [Pyrinomonadaceae bacterium]